ncbi:nitrogen regulation protein NR(I) [Psychrosphaera sp. B3R10]|uniref:nitrogen regulation protein NR(I) n=1 Tax=unclassified Psychrosphaera TaxID=2641570 RepID=UPI001C088AF2|nr:MULTISPECIES: nitrogen regulation protein NR(I) [unclassified Psychrosphaera]MBU2880344.1 nitrogen regulation protein NR(I) [Psychrosphaera sp. I2R16]MBU2987783.1 nitrogen regulation protein NR(I) [Psychrosphaera sp. B3R10]MDO6720707.1 nitrogen regulation protein NR(I) [Psychrosphaera sp. 1_MG-2023]
MSRVWIVDDDNSIRWVLEKALTQDGFEVESFASATMMLQRLEYDEPEAIISDIRMPEMDGMELLDKMQASHPQLPIIIMTAHSDLDSAVNAYQQGAFEYLPKPFDIDEAVNLTRRAIEHGKKRSGKLKVKQKPASEIIGEAPAMQEVFRAIGRLSRSSVSVLINGQSGTGKELVAHALHKHSPRKEQTFVALNMAAIPKDLIESELFGHEKGAFTGAAAARKGRFEQANGGTLFLDEIGDMPLDIQTRLLRVLADGQFYRVGGHEPVSVDVRIVAATHQNLENLVDQGKFREDLFHRLNVIRIHIPALRDRKEDIPQLCEHFLFKAAKELAVDAKMLSKNAAEFLSQYTWPGNVRQLENTCRWLTVMASGKEIIMDDLPPEMLTATSTSKTAKDPSAVADDWVSSFESWLDKRLGEGESDIIKDAQAAFERALIDIALRHTRGHKQEAAKRIGWGRNTITRKMQELNMG